MGDAAEQLRGPDSPTTFEKTLQSLKSTGCSLLVTGRAPPAASFGITRRLLGAEADRHRIVALTDRQRGTKPLLLPEDRCTDEQVTFIDAREFGDRSLADTTSGSGPDPGPVVPDADAEEWPSDGRRFADALAGRMCDAIEDMAGGTELAPGQLRTALVTLEPLFDQTSTDHVRAVCREVGEAVRAHRGMNHTHLPVPDDSDVVDALDEEFDARIELRRGSGPRPEQRWHVPNQDGPTEWMVL